MTEFSLTTLTLPDKSWDEISQILSRELGNLGLDLPGVRLFELRSSSNLESDQEVVIHFVRPDAEIMQADRSSLLDDASPETLLAVRGEAETVYNEQTDVTIPIKTQQVAAVGGVGGFYYKCKKKDGRYVLHECTVVNGREVCSNTGITCRP